ncbi:hypothetical protein BD410DRAFT_634856 [Rickenella mellea]|uniref:Uncharacterized protein n=1 Tax=Rickenella mellea TaxID=50990 RepID=A0A4Y7QEJ5_9AGAM|nr:hypothetical protein BD410DRAFT_634856 [Rickenella mellea]
MASIFSSEVTGISCIPAEVLSLIFIASIPDDIVTDEYLSMFPRPSVHQSPLVLGRVCRLWREISLKTPRLWCKIQLGDMKTERDGYASPHIHYSRDLGRDSVTLREWLRRSGNCPLSIGLCYEEFNESDIDLIRETIEVAMLYTRRWKHVTSYLTPPLFSWEVVSSLLEGGNPLLECLHILTDDIFAEERTTSFRHVKPHITSSMGDYASTTLTGCHSLRSLLLTSATITLEQFKLCVAHCPLLETIVVTVHNVLHLLTMTNVNDTYALPHLTDLHIFSAGDSIGPFLHQISCPLLEKLVLAQILEDDAILGTSCPHLGLFLRRSHPPLRYLDLTSIPMALDDFLDSFKEVPSLKSLSLDDVEVPDELFRILLLSPEPHQPLLPTLQSLTLTELPADINGETLTALILSRWKCQCELECSIGEISEHYPECQSLQSVSIDSENLRGNVDVGAIIEQGFKLIINVNPIPAL